MTESAEAIAEQVALAGWCVSDCFPGNALTQGLLEHCLALPPECFRPAGIGRAEGHVLDRSIRGDLIHWLDPASPAAPVAAWFDAMEALRQAVNARLFLGLFDYECHLARYPAGAFYRKHLDSFRGGPNRVLTTALYLNTDWQPDDGGELLLYPDLSAAPLARVAPAFARLAVFLSADFPHEVLPARRERLSLAGWFRLRP